MYYLRLTWSIEFLLVGGKESLRTLLEGLLTSRYVLFMLIVEHRISSGMEDESFRSLLKGLVLPSIKTKRKLFTLKRGAQNFFWNRG